MNIFDIVKAEIKKNLPKSAMIEVFWPGHFRSWIKSAEIWQEWRPIYAIYYVCFAIYANKYTSRNLQKGSKFSGFLRISAIIRPKIKIEIWNFRITWRRTQSMSLPNFSLFANPYRILWPTDYGFWSGKKFDPNIKNTTYYIVRNFLFRIWYRLLGENCSLG